MTGLSIAQPDVTLFLDLEGVIRDVELSTAVPERGVEAWRGRPWAETVLDVGGDKVRRMVEDARTHGVSGFRQVTQRFPSGLELPVEYTTVRLGGKGGLVAIGKNLQAVAELQSRLIAAQQAMERDYWKLREVETRYRLLFDASTEAVLLVRASNLRVIEANPAAIRALGLTPAGRDLLGELAPTDREPFQAMLVRVREHGKAPGVLLHLGREGRPWLVRASLIAGDPGPAFLVQLTPAGTVQPAPGRPEPVPVADSVDRLPDGFVVIDRDGTVLHANRAFLDLVQLGAEGRVLGERLGRWLGRPGADLAVLVANVQRHGAVRLFPTTIHGELGAEIEVELSAVGGEDGSRQVAVLVRDVGQRLPPPSAGNGHALTSALGSLTRQVGRTPLRRLVQDTTSAVERHYIDAALELTGGNRTAAAELLGLSRQSLYAKLNRYGPDGADPAPEGSG